MASEDKGYIELEDSIFNGILFALEDDSGPQLKFNASTLSDREAIATAIQGITAVGLGEEDIRGLFGPLPVPYNPNYKALVYIFNVDANQSSEAAILERGRFCALFIIFRKTMLRLIANVFSMIESLLNIYQESYLKNEKDLKLNSLQLIYEEIVDKLKVKPRFRLFKVEDNITIEFEEKKANLGSQLFFIIDEKEKTFYYFLNKNLEKEISEKAIEAMEFINNTEYQKSFKQTKISSKKSLLQKLENNNITVIE
ncbi:MAG: hypothetical protein ACFFDW_06065 [Candidatus Thorarchaeota archaeon]